MDKLALPRVHRLEQGPFNDWLVLAGMPLWLILPR
ncbi:MAG: hypothetical protein K0R61_4689 [Microvirga sp.]|jgi:hypothetical protein|nr:hypothetical protein [Microvirga sp.]